MKLIFINVVFNISLYNNKASKGYESTVKRRVRIRKKTSLKSTRVVSFDDYFFTLNFRLWYSDFLLLFYLFV